MYSFCLTVQYLGIVVLILEVVYVYRQRNSKLQVLMLTVMASTLINFIGYLFEMRATELATALQAVKIIYLGKPYIVLCMFLFIMQYHKVRLPALIKVLLGLMHFSITGFVMGCERIPIYYSSIDYTQEGLFPHLVLGKGVVYIIYNGMNIVYLLAILIVSAQRYRKTTNKKKRMNILCLCCTSFCVGFAYLFYLTGITQGYDSTLPAYVVATTLLFISMRRYSLLDPTELARESVMDDYSDGLVVLDADSDLVYFNQVAHAVYPDLCSSHNAAALEELERDSKSPDRVFRGDKVYYVSSKDIIRDHVVYGKMYVASDVTGGYNYAVQLQNQTAIAEQANQAKSDFLARMSHEIRTPINAVLGMNEMILRESSEDAILSYAADVKTSANALLSIINDILDLSKIESGKLEILPVEYEPKALLNDVVNMITMRVKEKGLQMKVEVQESLPCGLFGDDVRIRQILTNLLTNAVKYTPKGTVTLRVSGALGEKKVTLHCEVEDTGIGIKEEDMTRLFGSYERLDEKKNRGIEGTGLGMSIVVDLLDLMGSRLEVESVYGKGSRFWFDLEQDVVNAQPMGSLAEKDKKSGAEKQYEAAFVAPEARVLVVDDNNMNRTVFRLLLKKTEVQIKDVGSGEECLEIVQKEPFDVIFLDHMMPDMDGVETLHRLKELEGNLSPNAPVVVLTANAVAGAREGYLAEGFDDFLSKPIIADKLENMIKKYVC